MIDFAIASIFASIASPTSQSADLRTGKFRFLAAGASDLRDDEFTFLVRNGWFLCFLLAMTGWTALMMESFCRRFFRPCGSCRG